MSNNFLIPIKKDFIKKNYIYISILYRLINYININNIININLDYNIVNTIIFNNVQSHPLIEYDYIDCLINNYIKSNMIQFIPFFDDDDKIKINKIIYSAIDNYINNNIHIIIDLIFDYFENFLKFKDLLNIL